MPIIVVEYELNIRHNWADSVDTREVCYHNVSSITESRLTLESVQPRTELRVETRLGSRTLYRNISLKPKM